MKNIILLLFAFTLSGCAAFMVPAIESITEDKECIANAENEFQLRVTERMDLLYGYIQTKNLPIYIKRQLDADMVNFKHRYDIRNMCKTNGYPSLAFEYLLIINERGLVKIEDKIYNLGLNSYIYNIKKPTDFTGDKTADEINQCMVYGSVKLNAELATKLSLLLLYNGTDKATVKKQGIAVGKAHQGRVIMAQIIPEICTKLDRNVISAEIDDIIKQILDKI